MVTIADIRKLIRQRRRSHVRDSAIAKELGVDQAEIKRILIKYPGEKVASRLGIPVRCHACHRTITRRSATKPKPPTRIGRDDGWMDYWMQKKEKG